MVEIGDRVSGVKPGDRVILPWKISCGACGKCQAGLTGHCQSVVPEAAYSWGPTAREWGGFLADLVAVPWAQHIALSAAWRSRPAGRPWSVRQHHRCLARSRAAACETPGGSVLVAGGGGPGSIGLMSVGLARALGAGDITYMDWDDGRREIAASDYQAAVIDTSDGVWPRRSTAASTSWSTPPAILRPSV